MSKKSLKAGMLTLALHARKSSILFAVVTAVLLLFSTFFSPMHADAAQSKSQKAVAYSKK
ncbi:hypothetical protein [Bacillus sp. D386]|uniref:hypothetical protein n=1 Tax=Bacillus sp. D386 TaxID=2587155 RepID=UPI00111D3141|nr:hypothetical protein [Bacillus sp. D386]